MLTRERPSIVGPTSDIGVSGSEDVTESLTASILESARGETELNLGSPLTLENGNSKGEMNIKARTRVSLVEPFRSFPEYGSGSILESTS